MPVAIGKPVSMGIASFCALIGALVVSAPVLAAGETQSEPKPAITEAPRLTGTPLIGQTLFCSRGGWANNPTGYTYTWLRNGSPIAGQAASTYTVQSADWGDSIACQVAASNAGGEYTIVGLPSGSYKVEFRRDQEGGNYEPQPYGGNPVSVTAPNRDLGINAAMSTGGQITGKATNAAGGAALAHVEVCANNASAGGCGSTNGGGEYTILGLPTGSYDVEFLPYGYRNYLRQSANGVSVIAGSTTSGINAALPTGGQITGEVTKAGGVGLANIEVCVTDGDGCATTNANGEYAISGLPSGSYSVEFFRGNGGGSYLRQYYNDKESLWPKAEVVPVVAGGLPASGIDAEMHPGGQIYGTVTAASGGAALANIEACVRGLSAVGEFGCAITNASGEYAVMGLPSGSYSVEFRPGREGGNYGRQPYGGNPVSVTVPSTTSGVNAEMHPAGQITGTVTAASGGAALANIEVCVGERPAIEGFGCATTNGSGEYTISGLSSGSYTVRFYPPYEGGNYLSQADSGVSVTAGSMPTIANAALPPGGQITGIVTATSGGAALANIEVCAYNPNGSPGGCATTNGGGGSASATSNALAVPVPNSNFSLAKAPVFDAKTGDLDFYFKIANAGTLRWNLSFRNSDVAFAGSLGLGLGDVIGDSLTRVDLAAAEMAQKNRKKCKAGFIKHKGKCAHTTAPFASGSKSIPAGTVEIKVHVGAKALKALKVGHTLHVGGPFTFQSALGGAPVIHTESATVHWPKSKKHGKDRRGRAV